MRHEGSEQLIGTSGVIAELSQEIDRIARSDAKVLITGESGVGKELVAHAIHQRSPRSARPMVAVNCAGLPETLLESELFGHVKGSFTGAYRDKRGKLEQAHTGTIFLDEVREMTARMQALLLRFLERGEVQPVAAAAPQRRVDARGIAATNRDGDLAFGPLAADANLDGATGRRELHRVVNQVQQHLQNARCVAADARRAADVARYADRLCARCRHKEVGSAVGNLRDVVVPGRQ